MKLAGFFIITLFIASFFLQLASNSAEAYVYVNGYYRSNGTYIEPYVRSNPNGIRYDNYGYRGGSYYNDSYYDSGYSSDWYTPSYYTDPDYYYGQSLYNSYSSYDYAYYDWDYDYWDY